MDTYSTGELAKLCHVTVRTVQYYDRKNVLKPAGVTQSQHRYYTQEQVQQLELILLLKDLGCTLKDIKSILNEETTLSTLHTLLTVKKHELKKEINQAQNKVNHIKRLLKHIDIQSVTPISKLTNISDIASNTEKLTIIRKRFWYATGIIGVFQYVSIFSSFLLRNKILALFTLPLIIVYSIMMPRIYFKQIAYLCPHCHTIFQPKRLEAIMAAHTLNTRKLCCPNCKETHYCIEIAK